MMNGQGMDIGMKKELTGIILIGIPAARFLRKKNGTGILIFY